MYLLNNDPADDDDWHRIYRTSDNRGCRLMNSEAAAIDVALAHRHFSGDCFNAAWSLIDHSSRTPAEDETMILLAYASLWRWTKRADVSDQHRSIGHWQVSRVHALAGRAEGAMWHAKRSLEYAAQLPPFYVGYAHEAIIRAALLQKDLPTWETHLRLSDACLNAIEDATERKMLEDDLISLRSHPDLSKMN